MAFEEYPIGFFRTGSHEADARNFAHEYYTFPNGLEIKVSYDPEDVSNQQYLVQCMGRRRDPLEDMFSRKDMDIYWLDQADADVKLAAYRDWENPDDE